MKARYLLYCIFAAIMVMFSSCSDFFEQDSDHVTFTDDLSLNNASDSVYSLVGIMTKLQALGDRTVLLGEVRGDLVDVTDAASADIRNLAQFNVSDDNVYNNPKDYYTVINNCNLFIAKVDTALKNNRNENIFLKEYAAVKAYRAWTYLQLVINYGSVPFVTEPIVTQEQANATYEVKGIQEICNWMVNDIAPLAEIEYPGYGNIGITDSRFLYFPIYLLMGELNLWAGNYKEAAYSYYKYITTANGSNSFYPTGTYASEWIGTSWNGYSTSLRSMYYSESYGSNRELITMIAGDSIPSDGNYSQLRDIYNSTETNNYKYSLSPSQSLKDLSASQTYCYVEDNDTVYVPDNLTDYRSGDLRLISSWTSDVVTYNDRKIDAQVVYKFQTRNIHIYRRAMVYLRLAEALNRAGYPHFAYEILSEGVNNNVIARDVLPYCTTAADSAFVNQFNFPGSGYTGYVVADPENQSTYYNTIGIHSRGSGWSQCNEYYLMPDDSTLTADARKQYQIEQVENMIIDEDALELAFEGSRYYDLVRVAMRRNDPSYLSSRIYGRRGKDKIEEVKAEIKKDLNDMNSWFISWGGKIGF